MVLSSSSAFARWLSVATLTCAFLATPICAHADTVTYFATPTAYSAAVANTESQNFSGATIAPGTLAVNSAPLTSSTANSIFPAGIIVTGLTISNAAAGNIPGLVVYGAGAVSGAPVAVGDNYFGDPMVLSFSPGVNAVEVGMFAARSQGSSSLAGAFRASIYDGTTLVDSKTVTELAGGFAYLGLSSTGPITSLDLLYTSDEASTLLTSIAFASTTDTGSGGSFTDTGSAGSSTDTGSGSSTSIGSSGSSSGQLPGTPSPVPEPSTLATFATGLGLAMASMKRSLGRVSNQVVTRSARSVGD